MLQPSDETLKKPRKPSPKRLFDEIVVQRNFKGHIEVSHQQKRAKKFFGIIPYLSLSLSLSLSLPMTLPPVMSLCYIIYDCLPSRPWTIRNRTCETLHRIVEEKSYRPD